LHQVSGEQSHIRDLWPAAYGFYNFSKGLFGIHAEQRCFAFGSDMEVRQLNQDDG
jgi:hypothetical protein